MNIDDLKTQAYDRMGTTTAWRSARNLSLEGEDPRDSKAPWVRLAELENHYTLAHHRQKAEEIANLYLKSGLGHYSNRVKSCTFYLDPSSPAFCRVRHCPICQWRRSQKFLARAFKNIPEVIRLYPKHRWIFMTLTVKNCSVDDLRSTWKLLNTAFVKLKRQKEFRHFEGYIKTIEVKKRWDGTAHPHIHCLFIAKSSAASGRHYISKVKLSNLWGECLGVDYKPVVHFKTLEKCDEKSLLHKILGCLKYQTKESELVKDFDWFAEMAKQVHRLKGIAFGGCIKSALSENDFVRTKLAERAKLIEDKNRKGDAVTNSTLPLTNVNPGGETHAKNILSKPRKLRFKRR